MPKISSRNEHDDNVNEVANNVKKDRTYRPKIPSDMPEEISELMQRCWDYDPAKRPTYLEIINYIEAYMDTI